MSAPMKKSNFFTAKDPTQKIEQKKISSFFSPKPSNGEFSC